MPGITELIVPLRKSLGGQASKKQAGQKSLGYRDFGSRCTDELHDCCRFVEVRASHRVPVLDVAQRDIAGEAEQPAHATAAGTEFLTAAAMVMVHVDALPR
jgi:hypothetical protein